MCRPTGPCRIAGRDHYEFANNVGARRLSERLLGVELEFSPVQVGMPTAMAEERSHPGQP